MSSLRTQTVPYLFSISGKQPNSDIPQALYKMLPNEYMDERIAKLNPLYFHMNIFSPKGFSFYFQFNEQKCRGKSQVDDNNNKNK